MKKKQDGYGMSLIFNNLESHKQAIYKLYPEATLVRKSIILENRN